MPVTEEQYNNRTQATADARKEELDWVPAPFCSALLVLTSGERPTRAELYSNAVIVHKLH